MKTKKKESWTLAELAEESGLSRRTIRYYISRGLLPGPAMVGRGAVYWREHLTGLQEIRRRKGQGSMLAEIARSIAEPALQTSLPEPQTWRQYCLAEDVMVWVRTDMAPWRIKAVHKALNEFAESVHRKEKEDDCGIS